MGATRVRSRERTLVLFQTIFNNDYYRAQRAEAEAREAFEVFVQNADVDMLAAHARTLHEEIHRRTEGTYAFTPGPAMREEGGYMVIDSSGKQGMPLSWYPVGVPGLHDPLVRSSEIERALAARIVFEHDYPTRPLQVFELVHDPRSVTVTFERYHRDIIETRNGMPRMVESGFYHLPGCREQFRVEGFRYPHPKSTFQC